MKRSAAVLALVAALALAVNASAAVYVGTGAEDPKLDVYFGVKKKPGKPRKVRKFTVVRVPTTCSDGSSHRTGDALPIEFPRRMKVVDRRFHGKETFTVKSTRGDYTVTMSVRGKLRRRGLAKGRVAISGPGPRPGVRCSSGQVRWVAARVRKS